jgi:hypothetical protein
MQPSLYNSAFSISALFPSAQTKADSVAGDRLLSAEEVRKTPFYGFFSGATSNAPQFSGQFS